MPDKFSIESSLRAQESFLKSHEDFLSTFDQKFGEGKALHERQAILVKSLEKEEVRIKALKEGKRTKQEKQYLWLTKCMKEFLTGSKPSGSATSMHQCYYTHNVDSRLFRKTKSGKHLGESLEIQKDGDPLSKLVDNLMRGDLTSEEKKKIKEYHGASEHKKILETSSVADTKKKLASLEKKLQARLELEKQIAKNMQCSSEIKLPLDNYKTDIVGDMLSVVLKRDFNEPQNYGKVCESFDGIKLKLMFKEKDPICSEEDKISLDGTYCDKSSTPNIIYNKDVDKARSDFRLLVVTQLTQKLPVGIIKNKISSAVIGMKNDKGECMYLVKNYEKGVSEWVSEYTILDKVEEIQKLKRQ